MEGQMMPMSEQEAHFRGNPMSQTPQPQVIPISSHEARVHPVSMGYLEVKYRNPNNWEVRYYLNKVGGSNGNLLQSFPTGSEALHWAEKYVQGEVMSDVVSAEG